jgi:hypothetical protein
LKDGHEEDFMQDAQRAVINARRAVYEAQLALERAQRNFQLAGIDPEELIRQFERYAGPAARQEFDRFVLAAAADNQIPADLNGSQLSNPESGVSPGRRLRFHV